MAPVRILVIDDDLSIRTSLTELFDIEGYETFQAADLGSAIPILQRDPVDVVVTDSYARVWDPELSWLGPLRDAAGAAKLVLFTAHTGSRLVEPDQHGLSAIWLKPMNIDELLSNLAELCRTEDPR